MKKKGLVFSAFAGLAATSVALIGSQMFQSAAPAASATSTVVESTNPNTESAIFAGGCFWCVESDFDHIPGVVATTSGYAGGHVDNPTYKTVTQGNSGHYEVVKIDYDPTKVSYDKLLTAFWHSTNPTDASGQFCDRGQSYETAIIALTPDQQASAERSKQDLISRGVPIVTPVLGSATFYPAETYHQDYYQKNPLRYGYYRRSCGRDRTVQQVWGDEAYKGIPSKQKGSN